MFDDFIGGSNRSRLRHRLLASDVVATLSTCAGGGPSSSDDAEVVPVLESDVADACSTGDARFYRTARRGDVTDRFVRGTGDRGADTWSVEFATTGPTDRLRYHTYDYGIPYGDPGVRLADVTALGYETYTDDETFVPMLTMEVDLAGPGTTRIDEYTKLTVDPSRSETVAPEAWQRWDVLDAGACVWLSDVSGEGVVAEPVTWDHLLERYPDASIKYGFGVGVGVGSDASNVVGNAVGNVDGLTIGVDGTTTRYNFEGRGASSQ